jgi:Heparinase II/III-like protein/Heparinase II/III N-terminus
LKFHKKPNIKRILVVTSFTWKYNRLKAMGLPELFHRVLQTSRAFAESRGLGLATYPPQASGKTGNPWLQSLPVNFHETRAAYIARADRILSGVFTVFSLTEANLGFPPNWNRDPKTGRNAPLDFGKTLDYRNPDIVGDIKYLWELNRHLELVSLAQAWHLSGDERFLDGARLLLNSWFDQSPYPKGINWSSSLELAIRLINWSFAWQIFGGQDSPLFYGSENGDLKHRWLGSIYQHCFFIDRHFSRHSSANNHLLGEYAGLFIGSVTWPLWKPSVHWLEHSRAGLETEVLMQNAEDGGNREKAIWYQHEVADMLLLCGLVGRANQLDFSKNYWARLEVMLEFIASLMDTSGQIPMIGDSDDAVMVEFSVQRDVYRSLLATGAVLFNRGDFKAKSTVFDDKTRWLLGDKNEDCFNVIVCDYVELPVHRVFRESGYYILGSAFETSDEIRMVADAGSLGYLSIAAHGHADALSVTLSVGGKEVLIDPGTYAYHTQPVWRDYFKGTAAHNTVRIDQLDQSISGGNFMWVKHAQAECLEFRSEDRKDLWIAQHDGYLRLRDPVNHQRTVRFDKANSSFEIKDSLICSRRHIVEIHWHCHEDCVVACEAQGIQIRFEDVLVHMTMSDPSWQAEIIRGQDDPPLGWVSRCFDTKVPCTTIRWKGVIENSSHLHTYIRICRTAMELEEGRI